MDNPLLKDTNNYDSSITNVKLYSPKIKLNPSNFTDLNNINHNINNINNSNINNNLSQKNEVVSLPKVNNIKEKEKKDNDNTENKILKHSQSAINIANNTFSVLIILFLYFLNIVFIQKKYLNPLKKN